MPIASASLGLRLFSVLLQGAPDRSIGDRAEDTLQRELQLIVGHALGAVRLRLILNQLSVSIEVRSLKLRDLRHLPKLIAKCFELCSRSLASLACGAHLRCS
jgi:hypothetical protein